MRQEIITLAEFKVKYQAYKNFKEYITNIENEIFIKYNGLSFSLELLSQIDELIDEELVKVIIENNNKIIAKPIVMNIFEKLSVA
jgi:arsenate reductase-like glutaredoxin family protein